MNDYDVHFSLNGFYKIEADSPEKAHEIVEQMFASIQKEVEAQLCTGVGIEVYEVVEGGIL